MKTLPAITIREARARLGWTKNELGEALGVSARTIEHYEEGRNVPKPVKLLLARVLKEAAESEG